ncbi:MAG: helix-turn-helix transcriptional regulator [Clostridiales bacterium]|nr:helix-turn-helix transcriptional regulator [Clostridiales bacterium]
MIDTTAVGKTIAALRQQKGLSQQALADLCSVTHQAVSKWENGLALPDIQTLLFLSRHFGVTMEDILSGNVPAQAAEASAPEAPVQDHPAIEEASGEPAAESAREDETDTSPDGEDESGMDWEQLIAMLPFAGQETADQLLLDAMRNPQNGKPDRHVILAILPFASREVTEAVVTYAMENLDADLLPALAPFVSTQFLADLVRQNDALMNGEQTHLLQSLIPFLPGELVDELIQRGAAKGLRWKKKGQKGSLRYNLDIDLGSMRKLQHIGKYIGDTVGSVFNNLGTGLQSASPEMPETPSAPAARRDTERPLMRIARKAVESDNVDWLEEHFYDLEDDEKTELCHLILREKKWDMLPDLMCELNHEQVHLLCEHAVKIQDSELIRTLAEEVDDEACLQLLLDAAIQADDWELIDLLSENM